MRLRAHIFILTIFLSLKILGQNSLQIACADLVQSAYVIPFSYNRIELEMINFSETVKISSIHDLNSCKCADSLWIKQINDNRNFEDGPAPQRFLRNLVSVVDSCYLDFFLNSPKCKTLEDSLNYVINRMKNKFARKDLNEHEWRNFYWCFDPESEFLKENVNSLYRSYLKIFDNPSEDDRIRNFILVPMNKLNITYEQEILNRMENPDFLVLQRRMLYVLALNGSTASVNFLTNKLQNNSMDLKQVKDYIGVVNTILDLQKVKKKARKHFENYLHKSGMDKQSLNN